MALSYDFDGKKLYVSDLNDEETNIFELDMTRENITVEPVILSKFISNINLFSILMSYFFCRRTTLHH